MPRRARKPPPSPVIGRDCHDFSKCCARHRAHVDTVERRYDVGGPHLVAGRCRTEPGSCDPGVSPISQARRHVRAGRISAPQGSRARIRRFSTRMLVLLEIILITRDDCAARSSCRCRIITLSGMNHGQPGNAGGFGKALTFMSMGFKPQCACGAGGIKAKLTPPRRFVAVTMNSTRPSPARRADQWNSSIAKQVPGTQLRQASTGGYQSQHKIQG
jgi:hypothetical protein